MLQSFFNGLSGLFSFSRGLNTVSNNVSNMNTPGFRGSDSFFRSINGGQGGYGTILAGSDMRLASGEVRQTGNATDLALNGSGFFVLRDDNGTLFYTRAGQFRFNEDGILIDSVTQYQVMALDDAGNLSPINISALRTLPAEATTQVNLTGILSTTATSYNIENIKVFDAGGTVHTLTAELARTAADTWSVTVKDQNGVTVGNGTVRFGPDNTPLAGFNTLNVSLTVAGATQAVSLNFGDAGSFTGVYQTAGAQNSVSAQAEDGHAILGLTSLTFDENGQIKLEYSNGDKEDGAQIAIATFADESALIQSSGSLYRSSGDAQVDYGFAGQGINGKVQGGSIELSNVDLTQEFADMMIIQRGYQASSRIMSVSNEMVEQLYNNTRGG